MCVCIDAVRPSQTKCSCARKYNQTRREHYEQTILRTCSLGGIDTASDPDPRYHSKKRARRPPVQSCPGPDLDQAERFTDRFTCRHPVKNTTLARSMRATQQIQIQIQIQNILVTQVNTVSHTAPFRFRADPPAAAECFFACVTHTERTTLQNLILV